VLGWAALDKKPAQAAVNFIEVKEMACDALLKQSTTAGISSSSYKSKERDDELQQPKTTCQN
jgi:hypothetical protein